MNKSRVLFLCTGNSCRSQIAEAFVNAKLGEAWQASSAGSKPAGVVHPLALKVLSEIGIDHHGRPKSMDEFSGQSFDLVVTLCNQDADECPIWLGKGKKVHLPFSDPAKATGSETAQLTAFRNVRDGITAELAKLLSHGETIGE